MNYESRTSLGPSRLRHPEWIGGLIPPKSNLENQKNRFCDRLLLSLLFYQNVYTNSITLKTILSNSILLLKDILKLLYRLLLI